MSAFEHTGIIEGFYGPPWSFEDRHRAVAFLGEHGGNTYVYAPKNDPLHRDRWREPYLPEDWERFGQLSRAAERAGIRFWFGISPLQLRVTNERDVDLLLAKVAAADEAGIRHLCLLVDDMPEDFASTRDAEQFGSLAAAHAAIVRTVLDAQQTRGPHRELWFVPLRYHGDPDDGYVREIGELVPPEVAVMWTGPEVCSETITAQHARAVAASLRRPVLLWDNHPVNDGGMRHDPHLGPLRGRDPRLGDVSSGILSNVAIEPEASLVAVATFLTFAADPSGYEPDAAWRHALATVTGDAVDADAVAVLAALSPRSPIDRRPPSYAPLAPLDRFVQRWQSDRAARRPALDEVAGELSRLLDVAERLHRSLGNARLRADLLPWSSKLRLQVQAAAASIDVLSAALDAPGTNGPAEERRRVVARVDEARRSFHRIADNRLEVFARGCLHRADELAREEEGR